VGRFGVLDPRGVGGQLPDGHLAAQRMPAPLRDEAGGRIVQVEQAVRQGHQERHAPHQGLGERGGAVAGRGPAAGRVPLVDDLPAAHHQEVRRAAGDEAVPVGNQAFRAQALAFGWDSAPGGDVGHRYTSSQGVLRQPMAPRTARTSSGVVTARANSGGRSAPPMKQWAFR